MPKAHSRPIRPTLDGATTPPRPKSLDNPTSPVSPISPWPPLIFDEPASADASTTKHASVIDASGVTEGVTETLPSAKEIYGFLAAFLTYFAFALYLAWAILPEAWLDAIGWTWYPEKEWALIVPCYLMLIVPLAYLCYAALTAYHTPSVDSISFITDSYSHIPQHVAGEEPYYRKFADPNCIPEAVDLPIEAVCRTLYPPRKRRRKPT